MPDAQFDPRTFRLHVVVDGAFNRRKQWRGIATRYDHKGPQLRHCDPARCSSPVLAMTLPQTQPGCLGNGPLGARGCL